MKDGAKETRRVIYHLPNVLRAQTVFVAEGEKDSDRLVSLSLAATCNPGGAAKWFPSYSQSLKGKDVVILPDNDEPGAAHALMVAKSVLPVAKSVKVVPLPGLPPKGDVSDFLAGRSKEELLKLVDAAPLFTGATDKRGQNQLWPEFLTAKDILQAPHDPTRWTVEDFLPRGGASACVAKPKIGKTVTVADLCISVARGEPWLGRATQQSPVAYLFLDGTLPEIADVFVSLGLRETDPVYLHAGSAPQDCINWLISAMNEKGVKLVVIDTLQKLLKFKDLNDYAEVTNRMGPLLDAARQGNCHIVLLHHAKKESGDDLDAAIGSTAIRGLCYTYIFLKRLADSDRRIIRSDQRGGKNFPETAIGFGKSGRLETQGTMEDVEIDEAKPKVRELLATEENELTEREIRALVPIKAIVVSKALRQMFTAGEVERTGEGRKGRPFRYSLAADLMDVNATNVNTCPNLNSVGNGRLGHESQKPSKALENTRQIQVPEERDTNGTRIDTNEKTPFSGHESDDDGWEVIE